MPVEDDKGTEGKAPQAPVTDADIARAAAGQSGSGGAAKQDGDDGKHVESAAKSEPQVITIGDDEYETDEKGYIKIPASSFKRRLNKYSKAELKAAFGTTDVDDIKARLDEHGKLKAKSEEERRKQLAKEEQLAEDLRKEQDARKRAEMTAAKLAEDREYRDADQAVRRSASKYIANERFLKLAVYEFGEYVSDELDESEANALTPADVDKWFKKYSEDNPDFSKQQQGKSKEEKPKEKRAMSVGGGESNVEPKSLPTHNGKTPRPGQSNSMTDKEYKDFLATHGIRT